MKKITKIVAFFISIIGIIVAIFYFAGGLEPDNSVGVTNQTFQRYHAQIEKNWLSVSVWDQNVYDDNRELLYGAEKKLGRKYATLMDLNNEIALNRLDSVLMKEFAKKKCDESVFNQYMPAVSHIKKCDGKWAKDSRLKEMEGTYDLYKRIKSFCNCKVYIEPDYDLDTCDWTDFEDYKEKMLSKKAALTGSQYYKKVKNNAEFTKFFNGLNAELSKANDRYVSELERQIEEQFSKDKSTLSGEEHETRLQLLENIRQKFNKKYYSDYSALCSKLNYFARNY